jgi:hypothetical protein
MHEGERGDAAEVIVRTALREFLPKRFSLGTGFIVSSNRALGISRQQDIVIYDEFLNSAIMFDNGVGVFPIECVYGVVEVTTSADTDKIINTLKAIREIRLMKDAKRYVSYARVPVRPGSDKKVVEPRYFTLHGGLAPRSYLFAFGTKIGKKAVENAMKSVDGSFLHGATFFDRKWSYAQRAYHSDDEQKLGFIRVESDRAVMSRFLWNVRYGVESLGMAVGAIDQYLPDLIKRPGDVV